MKVKVLGISEYEKEGKKYYNVYCATPFSDRMIEAGAVGLQVKSVWSPESSVSFAGVEPGDYLDLEYEPGFQDKATLVGFKQLTTPFSPYIEGIINDEPKSTATKK